MVFILIVYSSVVVAVLGEGPGLISVRLLLIEDLKIIKGLTLAFTLMPVHSGILCIYYVQYKYL